MSDRAASTHRELSHNSAQAGAGIPFGTRAFPAEDGVCFVLAALRYPEARARFRELGIGPEAFEFSEERAIAAALFGKGTIDGAVSAVLDRDDGCHLPWRRAIDFDLDPQWALDLTNRFAAARARRWFPSFIGWILEGLAAGRPLSWVACEIAWALDQIRPIVEAEGRS